MYIYGKKIDLYEKSVRKELQWKKKTKNRINQ